MKDILSYKYYIFDFDGVILESVNIKTQAFRQLYLPYGQDVAEKVVEHHLSHGGLSRFEKFKFYHKNFLNKEISDTQVMSLAQEFGKIVLDAVLKAPFIDGAIDFLELLKKNNKTIFLISATPEDEIKKIISLRKIGGYFRDIKGSPQKKKDNLEGFINEYNLNYADCVYFGDSQEDLKAARIFNIDFIAINFFDKSQGFNDFKEFILRKKIGSNYA